MIQFGNLPCIKWRWRDSRHKNIQKPPDIARMSGCCLMVPSYNPGSFGPQHLNVGPLSIFQWGTVALLPVLSPVPPSVEIRFQHISKWNHPNNCQDKFFQKPALKHVIWSNKNTSLLYILLVGFFPLVPRSNL